MQSKTKAIVLSKIRYRDNDLIVKCYSENDGLVSYFERGILKTKKSSNRLAYYQLLTQLQIDQYFKETQSLRTIKEVKPVIIYNSIHTDVKKSTIAMFLAEVLTAVLKEEEPNPDLYQYLESGLQWLDAEVYFANFHLLFLLKLTKYLGFYPNTVHINYNYFNLESGKFEDKEQLYYSISGKNLEILKSLLGINFDALKTIDLNSSQRQSFLTVLLLYFELHLGNFKKPRSLVIFNQVFK